jgi:hypothetical protein
VVAPLFDPLIVDIPTSREADVGQCRMPLASALFDTQDSVTPSDNPDVRVTAAWCPPAKVGGVANP